MWILRCHRVSLPIGTCPVPPPRQPPHRVQTRRATEMPAHETGIQLLIESSKTNVHTL
jgi:hypothetical protein